MSNSPSDDNTITTNGTTYSEGTDRTVIAVLEHHRIERKHRLRITLGDTLTGTPWEDKPEEGYIGRTTGQIKAPIIVHNARSLGGSIISTNKILRIEYASAKMRARQQVLYLHPSMRVVQ